MRPTQRDKGYADTAPAVMAGSGARSAMAKEFTVSIAQDACWRVLIEYGKHGDLYIIVPNDAGISLLRSKSTPGHAARACGPTPSGERKGRVDSEHAPTIPRRVFRSYPIAAAIYPIAAEDRPAGRTS